MPKKKAAAVPERVAEKRAGETRRPLERIFTIHEAIARGRYPNCRQLAEQIEVTPKTVQRDINFMRDELRLPIGYDDVRHGFFYERPVQEFPLLRITVEDVVALFLARQALEPLQGTPLEATLRESFRRLSRALHGEVTFQWSDLDEAFSVRSSGVVPGNMRLFEDMARAVLECREVRFDYRKIDADGWEPRSLQPLHLAEVDGGWYVIGTDTGRQARRTFALQRIKGLRVLKTGFRRPDDFDLAEHLGGSFGVWHRPEDEGRTHRIRLRFGGWAARIVSERRWHPSQQIVSGGRDGEAVEMVLELSAFEEIARWILSWGTQVEVLEPEALRARIRDELKAAAESYR